MVMITVKKWLIFNKKMIVFLPYFFNINIILCSNCKMKIVSFFNLVYWFITARRVKYTLDEQLCTIRSVSKQEYQQAFNDLLNSGSQPSVAIKNDIRAKQKAAIGNENEEIQAFIVRQIRDHQPQYVGKKLQPLWKLFEEANVLYGIEKVKKWVNKATSISAKYAIFLSETEEQRMYTNIRFDLDMLEWEKDTEEQKYNSNYTLVKPTLFIITYGDWFRKGGDNVYLVKQLEVWFPSCVANITNGYVRKTNFR
jgi:hypothetical protein